MEQLRYAPLPEAPAAQSAKLVVAHPPARNLSPQEHKLKLIQRIQEIAAANEGLADKNEFLNNTVLPLRGRSAT